MKTLANSFIFFFILSVPRCQDIDVSSEIETQLVKNEMLLGLTYPKSVKRFYQKKEFKSAWIHAALKPTQTWAAILLLDCALQFGLSHADYHPEELVYTKLREMINDPKKITAKEKARFEIVLTDALLTFINDLHYGKANPVYSRTRIDKAGLEGFSAEEILAGALGKKDFMATILNVQPKSKAYVALQKYMTQIRGQYLDNCYQIPEAEAIKVAINMERLKWNDVIDSAYIQVNIPSYTLFFNLPNAIYEFKVAIGKPVSPTPTLSSAISYVSTAPDWRVPQVMFVNEVLPKAVTEIDFLAEHHFTIYDLKGTLVNVDLQQLKKIMQNPSQFTARQSSGCELSLGTLAFHFPNPMGIYLYDGQHQQIFNTEQKAVTNSCVSVEEAKMLASLILSHDGEKESIKEMLEAANTYQQKNFILKHPIPISIVYQTCVIKNGQLVMYPDIYHQDLVLAQLLYDRAKLLTKIN